MGQYYLRLEGVNLDNFIYDTQDLSTVRGGGLLLLCAPEHAKSYLEGLKAVKQITALETICTGASSGIFRFECAEDTVEEIRRGVEEHLRKVPISLDGSSTGKAAALRHATFVVNVVGASDEKGDPTAFDLDRERLIALNRWRQMRSPSLAPPSKPTSAPDKKICEVDLVRPAARPGVLVGDTVCCVSESVYCRRRYGQSQKQEFYKRETQIALGEFVQDLDQLTDFRDKGNLHHKMAVIYLDGNGFGKLQRQACGTAELQKRFDEYLRGSQKGLLRSLLENIRADIASEARPNSHSDWRWWDGSTHRIRFETLLWGGDEIIWVVPAWQGWRVLGFFYQRARHWTFQKHRLTHAAGLVFCHRNAPIHRIKRVAIELAGLAKEKDRAGNLFAYQVLESFDHPGGDLRALRKRRCPPGLSWQDLVLEGEKMGLAIGTMAEFKRRFPKRRLHRIVQDLLSRGVWAARGAIQEAEADLDHEGKKALDRLKGCFGEGAALWLHVLDLWDYID